MVLLAPAPNWWIAFNPETCAIHKVWQGKVDFRGKVWDFSQNNSRAAGRIYYAAPTELWRLPNGDHPNGWKFDGVGEVKGAWTFPETKATLSTPVFNASGWRKLFLSFDESGRKGRFQVDIKDMSGKAKPQMFQSALSAGSETDFQFNFKRVERPTAAMQIEIHGLGPGKKLRNLRLYGDRSSWVDSNGIQVETIWGGYELVQQTKGVWLHYGVRLGSGKVVQVQHQPEITATGWTETFMISGLPPGEHLTMRRESQSPAIKINSSTPYSNGTWTFAKNGKAEIKFEIQESGK